MVRIPSVLRWNSKHFNCSFVCATTEKPLTLLNSKSGDRPMNNEILEILEVEEMEEVVAPGLLLCD